MTISAQDKRLLTIGEAADFLGVSTRTLLRWEEHGVLSPYKTPGRQRRYELADLIRLKSPKKKIRLNDVISNIPIPPPPYPNENTVFDHTRFSSEVFPNLYDQLPRPQKTLLKGFSTFALTIFGLFVFSKLALPTVIDQVENVSDQLGISLPRETPLSTTHSSPRVLAAESLENPIFAVNVDAIFRGLVNFESAVDITGELTLADNLTLNGDLLSDNATVNVFNEGVTTLNIGGAATTLTIGASGSTTTLNGSLVAGSSTLSSLIVTGTTTLSGLLDANGTGTNDIAGTLNLSGNTLTSGGDLIINPGGGGVSIGTGTANSTDMAGGDLFVTGDLEVDGAITGTLSGNLNPGQTTGSVLFQGAAAIAGDSTNFFWDDTSNELGIRTNTPAAAFDLQGDGRIGSGFNFAPSVDLGADLGTSSLRFNNIYADNLNIDSGFTSSGQMLITYNPADTTFAESSLRINVTTPSSDEQMLGIGQAGEERAAIDAEGDLTIGFDGASGSSVPTSSNPLNIYGHSTTKIMTVDSSGSTVIGGSDDTPDTTLEIFRTTGSDPTFSLTDGDVTHGLTTLANTDAILHVAPLSSTDGGTQLTALSDNVAGAQALLVRAVIGNTDPTDTIAAMKIIGGKSNGTTGMADLGAAETVFQVANNDDTAALTIRGNGQLGIGTVTPSQELDVAGDITLTGAVMGDSTDSLRLQAGGATAGVSGTASIFFLDSSGTTRGRFETSLATDTNFGTGRDGAISITSAKNINTEIISTQRIQYADGIAYRVIAPADSATSVTRFSSSDNMTNGIVVGDEVLIINLQGTSSDNADVGNYEFRRVSSVTSTTINFTTAITKSFDGTTPSNQKVIIQRVPNYTNVTLSSSGSLTASAWEALTTTPTGNAGYLTGIVAFRANGTVTIGTGTSITVASKGYRGGAGGSANAAGTDGESYDGTPGAGGTGMTSGGANQTTAGVTTAGGGGGGQGAGGDNTETPGGGGGGGYGGGGGGGGGGDDTGTSGNGGTGGAAGVSGGGGGGGSLAGATGGNGGNAGSAGGNGGAAGGAAGSGTTSGAGGTANTSDAGGGGGGGGGTKGATDVSTMYFGGGGGGGGGGSSAGRTGREGGGIIFMGAHTFTNSGTVSAIGGDSVAPISQSGASGAGAGGSIVLVTNTATLGSSTITATGGAATNGITDSGGGGGGGGDGRIRIEYTGSAPSGTTSPAASTSSTVNSEKQITTNETGMYGTFYLGAINTTAADVAEHYPSIESLIPGEIVVLDRERKMHIKRSTREAENGLLGIVSTNPGIILGQGDAEKETTDNAKTYPVVLSGRSPVYIDSTSETIEIGDYLTSSTTPGKAKKATSSGIVIGRALENWDPAHPSDKIMVFAQNAWIPILAFDDIGSVLASPPDIPAEASPSAQINEAIPSASVSQTLNLTPEERLTRMEEKLNQAIVDMDIWNTQNTLANPVAPSSSAITTSGLTTFGDTVITGRLNIGLIQMDSLSNSLDSVGTLKIQSLALGDIEFINGLIGFDKKGNVTITKGMVIGNSSFRGSEILKAGESSLRVKRTWETPPTSLTVTPAFNANVWITDKDASGFTIHVSKIPLEDTTIDWLAIW